MPSAFTLQTDSAVCAAISAAAFVRAYPCNTDESALIPSRAERWCRIGWSAGSKLAAQDAANTSSLAATCPWVEASQEAVAIDYIVALHYIMFVKPITYTRAAIKTLRRIPADMASRIVGKVEQYAADPAAQTNNVKALKDRDGIRLRVGDWRVVMDDGIVLAVLEIGPRGGIYD